MKKLFVVGLGPGKEQFMTQQAKNALEIADIICGYGVYVELVSPLYPDKPTLVTPMTKEVDRCRMALQKASEGNTVAMVCSGDSGVYGMACLIYELSQEFCPIEIEIVCGVKAALSGGAVLGAPLSHDFAVISLSDLLTPWELIEKRLDAAAGADFCISLYNPSSKKRSDYLEKACNIMLKHKAPQTLCGWVRNIGRDGQESKLLTLAELKKEQLDMFCTVFIGNCNTKKIGDKMVTPRGYELDNK
ncbi:MAG: precorrin-3B C(17)-methyltransferase [Oscillospiraceae bacterium]